jgi:ligand-binding SRPBCC domain-containing protein
VIALRFESRLAVEPAELWRHATSMAGVNFELMPLVRMTHPRDRAVLPDAGELPDGVLFHSWLLLFGLLPFDRHALCLRSIGPGMRFDEDSTSWMQRRWGHHRRIEPVLGGAFVIDELQIEPRIGFAAPLVRAIVTQLFRHRHRRLRLRFGALPG